MGIDKERVTREALALLDEVGLNGLTLRRLADRLGVKAPALYWHVANKQDLLDAMATTMVRDLMRDLPPSENVSWSDYLTELATRLRAALLRRRDGAKVFSGTYLIEDDLLQGMETPLRVLVDAGFSLRDAVLGYSTVYAYTIGFVIEEQAAFTHDGERDARYDPETRSRRIDAARFPLTVAAGEEVFGADRDARFKHGLALIVAGMERAVGRPA